MYSVTEETVTVIGNCNDVTYHLWSHLMSNLCNPSCMISSNGVAMIQSKGVLSYECFPKVFYLKLPSITHIGLSNAFFYNNSTWIRM